MYACTCLPHYVNVILIYILFTLLQVVTVVSVYVYAHVFWCLLHCANCTSYFHSNNLYVH